MSDQNQNLESSTNDLKEKFKKLLLNLEGMSKFTGNDDIVENTSILLTKVRKFWELILKSDGVKVENYNSFNKILTLSNEVVLLKKTLNIAQLRTDFFFEKFILTNQKEAQVIIDTINDLCDIFQFHQEKNPHESFVKMLQEVYLIFEGANHIEPDKISEDEISFDNFFNGGVDATKTFHFWSAADLAPLVINNLEKSDLIRIVTLFARLKTNDSTLAKKKSKDVSLDEVFDIQGMRFVCKGIKDVINLYELLHKKLLQRENVVIKESKVTLIDPDEKNKNPNKLKMMVQDNSYESLLKGESWAIHKEVYKNVAHKTEQDLFLNLYESRYNQLLELEGFVFSREEDGFLDLKKDFLSDMVNFANRRKDIFRMQGELSALDATNKTHQEYLSLYNNLERVKRYDEQEIKRIQQKYYFTEDGLKEEDVLIDGDQGGKVVSPTAVKPFLKEMLSRISTKNGIVFSSDESKVSSNLYLGLSVQATVDGMPSEFSITTALLEFFNETIADHASYKKRINKKIKSNHFPLEKAKAL